MEREHLAAEGFVRDLRGQNAQRNRHQHGRAAHRARHVCHGHHSRKADRFRVAAGDRSSDRHVSGNGQRSEFRARRSSELEGVRAIDRGGGTACPPSLTNRRSLFISRCDDSMPRTNTADQYREAQHGHGSRNEGEHTGHVGNMRMARLIYQSSEIQE